MPSATESTPAVSAVLAPEFASVSGVLFDIDDTLVDLAAAMNRALRTVSEHLLPGMDAAGWEKFGRIFTHETTHIYDRYLAGELTFNEQRLLRGRAALGHFGVELGEGAESHSWLEAYSRLQPRLVRTFDDVLPVLNALDDAGIPYGAISNNVHDYQRAKLDSAGLERIRLLVGTDTVGVPKPDPAIFLEGVRLLGTIPAQTLYIGDNRLVDADGARAAGLLGVWLNRDGEDSTGFTGAEVKSLLELLA